MSLCVNDRLFSATCKWRICGAVINTDEKPKCLKKVSSSLRMRSIIFSVIEAAETHVADSAVACYRLFVFVAVFQRQSGCVRSTGPSVPTSTSATRCRSSATRRLTVSTIPTSGTASVSSVQCNLGVKKAQPLPEITCDGCRLCTMLLPITCTVNTPLDYRPTVFVLACKSRYTLPIFILNMQCWAKMTSALCSK